MRRILLSMATILLFSSCNELATLKYYPFPGVAIVLKLNKVTQHDNGQDKYTFAHISYSIDHLSDQPLSFEVYNIKATINGISNTSAYYDTIASVVPGPQRIGKGKSNLNVYVVFPGVIKVSKDTRFAILNLGLSQSVTIKSPFAPVDRSLTRLYYQTKHTSTQKSREAELLKTTLSRLNVDHPEMDVEKNMRNKDLRFIGINSYGCYAPGVEQYNQSFIERYGINCLNGTSDRIEDYEHGGLIQTAIKYAKEYNRNLLMKLKSK